MAIPRFSFQVQHPGIPADTFDVIAFKGREYISRPFRYVLRLLSENHELDFAQIVNQPAELVMDHDGTAVPVTGIVADVRQVETRVYQGAEHSLYTATFVPALWRLRFYHRSRVFQQLKVGDILRQVLSEAGIAFDLALDAQYPTREFTVQYNETDLDFIQRLMEFEGIYYFFSGGRLVVTDTRAREPGIAGDRPVRFEEARGALTDEREHIRRFIRSQQIVPEKVRVRDYDYSAFAWEEELEQVTGPSDNGGGRVGTYYEHGRYMLNDKGWTSKKSDDEPGSASPSREQQVERIAQVRAGELETQRAVVKGRSNAARLRAGHRFELADHPRLSGEYLVTQVRHVYADSDYTNTFACLAVPTQFRPPRRTPVPRIPGIMTARVDGGASEAPPDPADPQYANNPEAFRDAYKAYQERNQEQPAYLDDEGRYRLRFPFDTGSGGDPSKPVRMAQPYSGPDYGMHFPNRAETEMVFAYLDGDPDQPLGLSTVPNPWKHSPVPNTGLKLGSQNPPTDSATGETTTFRSTKNVIRSQRGHQLVLDDDDGSANVGITLQAGSAKNSAGRDIYWGSKVELGGYRHLSSLESVLGNISTVVGYFRTVFARDFPGMASEALGVLASQITTDDYVDDTFGNTTPIGVNVSTNKKVNVTGKDGINITSPNLFGMLSTDLLGTDPDISKNQYQAEAISKFIVNTVWQEVINGTADELMDAIEATKEYAKNDVKNPKTAAAIKWTENFKEQRISALFFTLLQRSGINISSMGELKLSSLQSTSVAAGQGGLALKSFGNIEQKADLSVEISSHQGIKLSTKGRPYKGKGIFKALRKLGDSLKNPALKSFMGQVESRFSNVMNDPNKMFSIELNNDDGDIFLHTGGSEQKGEGDIMAHVEGKGDVRAFANKGGVHAWSGGEGITLEVGSRAGLGKDKANEPLADDKVGTRIKMTDKLVDVFGKDQVQLSTMDAKSSESFIKIDKGDKIEIKCGQSSIVLKKDGTITLKGKDLTFQGTGDVKVKGSKITSEAQLDHKVAGLNVASEAQVKNEVKGTMVNLDATGIAGVKGSLVKVG